MVNDKTQELWTDFPQIGGQIRRHWSASLGCTLLVRVRVAERPGELSRARHWNWNRGPVQWIRLGRPSDANLTFL